jgi:hypothetical protein
MDSLEVSAAWLFMVDYPQSGEVFVYAPSDPLKASLGQQGMEPKMIDRFIDKTLILSLYHL